MEMGKKKNYCRSFLYSTMVLGIVSLSNSNKVSANTYSEDVNDIVNIEDTTKVTSSEELVNKNEAELATNFSDGYPASQEKKDENNDKVANALEVGNETVDEEDINKDNDLDLTEESIGLEDSALERSTFETSSQVNTKPRVREASGPLSKEDIRSLTVADLEEKSSNAEENSDSNGTDDSEYNADSSDKESNQQVNTDIYISEILPDNIGTDRFDFFEVTNTTKEPITLNDKYNFSYGYNNTNDTSEDVPLSYEDQVVIYPQNPAVFWLSYQTDSLNSFDHNEEDFRAHFGIDRGIPLYRIVGQKGMANNGDRSIRVWKDGNLINWSYYEADDVSPGSSVKYEVPDDPKQRSMQLFQSNAAPSPGWIEDYNKQYRAYPKLIVSEIMPDTTGKDEFEYFEVTNITNEAIFLNSGYSFAYGYNNNEDTSSDVPLLVISSENIIFEPKESVVFWLSYTNDDLDSFSRTEDEFRQEFNVPSTTKIYRVIGQPGMANNGNRSIRIYKDGELDNWSFYEDEFVAPNESVSYRLPSDPSNRSMDIYEVKVEYGNPGKVEFDQLIPNKKEEQKVDIPRPLTAPPLVVTELLVDTENTRGSDAYEFIEIANFSTQPIDFSHFIINYLYPEDYDTNTNTILWPSRPSDITIQPGQTLTFWIKNGNNNHLTIDDFNQKFKTNMVYGENFAEIYTGGMANGSARGIQIQTNTGHVINRAYYNMAGKEVEAEQSFKYQSNDSDPTLQKKIDNSTPTPGQLEDYQIPDNFYEFNNEITTPSIQNLSPDIFYRDKPLDLIFYVLDENLVTTIALEIQTSADDETTTYFLEIDQEGIATHRIEPADLTGKDWINYRITAYNIQGQSAEHTSRTELANPQDSSISFNLNDGSWVSDLTSVIATGDTLEDIVRLEINGQSVSTAPSLADNPVFAFEATSTDTYFLNGVVVDGDTLYIFDEGTYSDVETISVDIPQDYKKGNNTLTVSIVAGTKAKTGIDPDENNDDFEVKGMRLVLPDGRTLSPKGYNDPQEYIRMGDSDGKYDYINLVFEIPFDAFIGNRYLFNPNNYQDGPHTITATNQAGEKETITIMVDKTGPVIETNIAPGSYLKGDIKLSAKVYDTGIGLKDYALYLDGQEINNNYKTSSVILPAGEHIFQVVAVDKLGNQTKHEISFITPEENPSASNFLPGNGEIVTSNSLNLQATVEDPTNDILKVIFKLGEKIDVDSPRVQLNIGTVNDALEVERGEANKLTSEEIESLSELDGDTVDVESVEAFPYQIFEINVGQREPGSMVRFSWSGEADGRAQVRLYVFNHEENTWYELDRHLTGNLEKGQREQFELTGMVEVDQFTDDTHNIKFLVQHSLGYAGPNYSYRTSEIIPNHPDDEPRSEYDFTFAWQADTQYYNEQYFQHQASIHDFIIDQRENMNIQYVVHSGDIVDNYDQLYQWLNANREYKRLDDAGIPYGVLAGNHDVGNKINDFTLYSKFFGEDRFLDNPWYMESHKDNRGHYDLISAGGIDFIIVHMSWEPGKEEIDWMNKVLAEHPERVAILNNHEFLQTTGGLGIYPQRIMDEVIAKNPNVRMVMSGHYHDAYTRIDYFDDNGDGIPDRTVTSMLFDYQGLPEGGLGFLRLLHFDNVNEVVKVRTYSESLRTYNSDDPSLLGETEETRYIYQEFDLPYAQLGIVPEGRILSTDKINIEVLSNKPISSQSGIEPSSNVSAEIEGAETGTYDWFIHLSDAYGGEYYSPIHRVHYRKVEESKQDIVSKVPVEYEVIVNQTSELFQGESRVVQKGSFGEKTIITRGDQVIFDEITKEPINCIVEIGTRSLENPYELDVYTLYYYGQKTRGTSGAFTVKAKSLDEAKRYFRNLVVENDLGDLDWSYDSERKIFYAKEKDMKELPTFEGETSDDSVYDFLAPVFEWNIDDEEDTDYPSIEGETSVDSVYDFLAPDFEWNIDYEGDTDYPTIEGETSVDSVYDFLAPDFEWNIDDEEAAPTSPSPDPDHDQDDDSQDPDDGSGQAPDLDDLVPKPGDPDDREDPQADLNDPKGRDGQDASDPVDSQETPKASVKPVKSDKTSPVVPSQDTGSKEASQVKDNKALDYLLKQAKGEKATSQKATSQNPQTDSTSQAKDSKDQDTLPDTATSAWALGAAGLSALLSGLGIQKFKKEDKED